MKSYRSLAIKELTAQKVTSLLILVAIILSTMMTTVVGQSLGTLRAMREQQAIAIGGNRYATFLQMDAEQCRQIRQNDDFSYVGTSIYLGSLSVTPSLKLGLTEYQGDNASIYPSSTSLKNGRLPQASMEIALPEDVLQYLGFNGNIGDTISLSLEKTLRHNLKPSYAYTADFVLVGILNSNYLGYTSGTISGIAGEGTAQQLLPPSHIYYNVDIRTVDKSNFQSVMDSVNAQLHIHELDTNYNIVYLNALGIPYHADANDADDTGFSFVAIAGILVGGLILFAAGLVIYNILKIAVSMRVKGYGTIRAIGGEKRQLYQIVVFEVLLLCSIGIPIGMGIGLLSADSILAAATGLISPELFLVQNTAELKSLIAENSTFNGLFLAGSGAITLLFAFAAALPAARFAANVAPVVALSGTKSKVRRRKHRMKKIRHFEAYYARLNLARNKPRTAITILSLVMSITVFIALQGFSMLLDTAAPLRGNHFGDYQITNETIGFTEKDLTRLQEHASVEKVAAVQFSLYQQNREGALEEIDTGFDLQPGETLQIVGLNDVYLEDFVGNDLTGEQLAQMREGDACIVRNPISISDGEKTLPATNINVNATIEISGTSLHVLKTLNDYDGHISIGNNGFTNGVQIIVSDKLYKQLTDKENYSEVLPTLKKDADRAAFDVFLKTFCDEHAGTTSLSFEKADQQLQESFAQIRLLAWGIIAFVGLIGLLNIGNTVYTNIHTRINEIGIQRALGMSEKSLYRTFLWEGAYHGLIAAFFGNILGYLCSLFIQASTNGTLQLVSIPVLPMLTATAFTVGACLLATAIPLKKISGMSIVCSIETIE